MIPALGSVRLLGFAGLVVGLLDYRPALPLTNMVIWSLLQITEHFVGLVLGSEVEDLRVRKSRLI